MSKFCPGSNGGKGGDCPHKGKGDTLCRDNKIYKCPGWESEDDTSDSHTRKPRGKGSNKV